MIYFHKYLNQFIIVNWVRSYAVHVSFEDGSGLLFEKKQWGIVLSMYEFIGEL